MLSDWSQIWLGIKDNRGIERQKFFIHGNLPRKSCISFLNIHDLKLQ